MPLFDISGKSHPGIEQKSLTFADRSFAEFLFSGGNGDLGAAEALRLYYQCKPFFHAIKKRTGAFSDIQPRVWDVTKKEFIDDHPVLAKLKHPNPFQSYEAWAMELAESLDVTGNSFPLATGNIQRPPLELFVARPQTVNLQRGNRTFFYPEQMTVSTEGQSRSYALDEVRMGDVVTARYYDGRDGEIWQAKQSNLFAGSSALWGISTAQPLWMEIQQFIESNNNNLSILRRGGQVSLGWTWTGDSAMTDDQFARAREELKKYTGAQNAGRQAIVDKLKPEPIAQSLRDMEFSVNRKTMQEDIYTTYDIPLAMISSESMTLDNLKTSEFLFWRDAVLPLAGFLYGELTRFLLPRYGDFKGSSVSDMKITFNPFDIEVLKRQRIQDVGEMQGTHIFTDNELRTEAGFEALGEGGDSVWKPTNQIPAESDLFTNDQLRRPAKDLGFVEDLKAMKRADGERMFTDAEIDYYLRGGV